MKRSMFFVVPVLLLVVGFFSLPTTGAVYQDTKTGVINIRVTIPEEAPAVPVSMTPDAAPLAAEEAVSEQSSAPVPPIMTTTAGPVPVSPPTPEPSAPEEPTTTSSIPTEEKEPSSGPTVP